MSAIEDQLLKNVKVISAYIKDQLQSWQSPLVEEIRGQGFLIGLKITKPVAQVVAAAAEQGLLVTSAKDNVIRLLPPLNVTKDVVDQALAKLKTALERE